MLSFTSFACSRSVLVMVLTGRIASGTESITKVHSSENFYNDFEDESIDAGNDDDDEEDDDYIDTEQLGDWRTFRLNLAETGNGTCCFGEG